MYSQDYGLEFLAKAKPLRPRPQSQGQGQPIARPRPQNLALRPRARPSTNITGWTYIKNTFRYVVDPLTIIGKHSWEGSGISRMFHLSCQIIDTRYYI